MTRCSIFETSQSLFWAGFGLVDLTAFDLTGIKSFTRFWGLLLFGSYSVINIIVLLNMLIAMMSNSYQIISVGFSVLCVRAFYPRLPVLSNRYTCHRNGPTWNGSSPGARCGFRISRTATRSRLRLTCSRRWKTSSAWSASRNPSGRPDRWL